MAESSGLTHYLVRNNINIFDNEFFKKNPKTFGACKSV